MIAPVVVHADATTSSPALVLRPWCEADVAALVEAGRDPVLRRWTSFDVANAADALRWVGAQERGWAAGDRFGFAVLEAHPETQPAAQPEADRRQLVGHVVLKDVAPGKPSAEVGYWTASHARGRGVAPRALEALTGWAFSHLGADHLTHLELLHSVGNQASCRVAHKSGYRFDRVLPAMPPSFPHDGHLHSRHRDD